MQAPNYQDSIFINCPFDDAYQTFLHCIVFAVYRCGFTPRSALEEDDNSDMRLDKIVRLIELCRFSIHDISRIELDAKNSLPRFNMPFELGLFWGAKKYGSKTQRQKAALIFERNKYSYQKYLSDINGADIKAHEGEIKNIIKAIRNWLYTTTKKSGIPSASVIEKDYNEFLNALLPVMLAENQAVLSDLTFNDFCAFVSAAITVKLMSGSK